MLTDREIKRELWENGCCLCRIAGKMPNHHRQSSQVAYGFKFQDQFSFPGYRSRTHSFLTTLGPLVCNINQNGNFHIKYFMFSQFLIKPGKGSKKAKKSGSNIFSLFSQKQIQEFKEAFGIIDVDKDGIITANDLKAAFVNIGRPITDGEANNLVGEAPGPINFTQMVTLFAEKMAGG